MRFLDSQDITNVPARTNFLREQEQLAIRAKRMAYENLAIVLATFVVGALVLGLAGWVDAGMPK